MESSETPPIPPRKSRKAVSRSISFGRNSAHGLSPPTVHNTLSRTSLNSVEIVDSDYDHDFVLTTYRRPTNCFVCNKMLVGIINQGYQCKNCEKNSHKKCFALSGSCGQNKFICDLEDHVLKTATYKQPTYCDECGKLLIGVVCQGKRCSICKHNFHSACIKKVFDNPHSSAGSLESKTTPSLLSLPKEREIRLQIFLEGTHIVRQFRALLSIETILEYCSSYLEDQREKSSKDNLGNDINDKSNSKSAKLFGKLFVIKENGESLTSNDIIGECLSWDDILIVEKMNLFIDDHLDVCFQHLPCKLIGDIIKEQTLSNVINVASRRKSSGATYNRSKSMSFTSKNAVMTAKSSTPPPTKRHTMQSGATSPMRKSNISKTTSSNSLRTIMRN